MRRLSWRLSFRSPFDNTLSTVRRQPAGAKSPENDPTPGFLRILPPVALPGRFPKPTLTTGDFNPSKTVDYNPTTEPLTLGHGTDRWCQPNRRAGSTQTHDETTGETPPFWGPMLVHPIDLHTAQGQWKRRDDNFAGPRTEHPRAPSRLLSVLTCYLATRTVPSSPSYSPIMLAPILITIFDQRSSRFGFLDRLDCVQGFSPLRGPRGKNPQRQTFISRGRGRAIPHRRSRTDVDNRLALIWSITIPTRLTSAAGCLDRLFTGVESDYQWSRCWSDCRVLEPYLPAKIEQRAMRPRELVNFLKPWSPTCQNGSPARLLSQPLADGRCWRFSCSVNGRSGEEGSCC
jgi:hypothetical protein